MEKLEIQLGKKSKEILDKLKAGCGYDTYDEVIRELILTMDELIEMNKRQTRSDLAGILNTFTRFTDRVDQ